MHSHEIEANDRSHKIAPKHSPKRSDMNSMCSPNVEHNYADDNKMIKLITIIIMMMANNRGEIFEDT